MERINLQKWLRKLLSSSNLIEEFSNEIENVIQSDEFK